jgi:6-phosphogluconolactonase (cycloisomerase 2 family)
MARQLLYVVLSDEDCINIYERAVDGALALFEQIPCAGAPMWLCTNPELNRMYCCTLSSSELVTFQVDPTTGSLIELKRIDYPSSGLVDRHGDEWTGPPCPCFVSMDRTGKFVLTSFYTAGMVTVHGTDNGIALAPEVQTLQTSHGCHAIYEDPAGPAVYVPCVAAWSGDGHDPNNARPSGNCIYRFSMHRETGLLSQQGDPLVPPPTGPTQEPRFGLPWQDGWPTNRFGSRPELGPRHLCFHPSQRVLLTSNEQDNSVTSYAIAADGTLAPTGTESTVPSDFNGASHTSEIRVHPSGSFVVVPNRGHDSVAAIALSASGSVSSGSGGEVIVPTAHTPQAIELSPDGSVLFVAGGVENSATDRLTVFRVRADGFGADGEGAGGVLEKVSEMDVGKNPIRMLAVDLPHPHNSGSNL